MEGWNRTERLASRVETSSRAVVSAYRRACCLARAVIAKTVKRIATKGDVPWPLDRRDADLGARREHHLCLAWQPLTGRWTDAAPPTAVAGFGDAQAARAAPAAQVAMVARDAASRSAGRAAGCSAGPRWARVTSVHPIYLPHP